MNDDNGNLIRDNYDRTLAVLDGLPDVTQSKPSTVRTTTFIGLTETWIITTYRQREQGDTVALERVSGEGGMRIILPADVTAAIARQRDSVTTKVRRKIGKERAAADKAAGIKPGFMRKKADRHADK